MNVGDIAEVHIWVRICCEECDQIDGNHMNCPVCLDTYADVETIDESDMYDDLEMDTYSWPYVKKDVKHIICGECSSVFERVSEKWYEDCKVKLISKGFKKEKV